MEEKFMLEALKEAKKSYNKGDVPVGAIIVYNNKIIARAHNLKEKSKNNVNGNNAYIKQFHANTFKCKSSKCWGKG